MLMEYEEKEHLAIYSSKLFCQNAKNQLKVSGHDRDGIGKFLVIFLFGVETMLNASLIRSQEVLEGVDSCSTKHQQPLVYGN